MRIARLAVFALLSSLPAVAVLTGCGKPESGPPEVTSAQATPATPPGQTAGMTQVAGRLVFDKNNCANCHTIAGRGANTAPDLSKIGSEHDPQWIIAHVKNPKTHKADSRMPAFAGKITDQELTDLGNYLASLK